MEGRKDGWMGGRVEAKAGLRIAYSNQEHIKTQNYQNLKMDLNLRLTVGAWTGQPCKPCFIECYTEG